MRGIGIALLLSVLALIAPATAMAADAMTNAELTALLAKGTVIGLGGPGSGYDGKLTLNADGTGKGEAKTDSGDVIKFEGTWTIEGDQFCRTWTGVGDGKHACETWVKDGASKVHVMVGDQEIGVNYW